MKEVDYNIYDLIADIERLIDTHPDIDFSNIEIYMNSGEYNCKGLHFDGVKYLNLN